MGKCSFCGKNVNFKKVERPVFIHKDNMVFPYLETYMICPLCGHETKSKAHSDKALHNAIKRSRKNMIH